MTLEGCLCVLFAVLGKTMAALLLERLCSCYFPFLLSARYYYPIRNRRLQALLISPQRTRSADSQTAPRDRNKLPLLGFLYCAVILPWLLCELALVLWFTLLCLLGLGTASVPLTDDLKELFESLFLSSFFWIFIAVMPLLSALDYSLGLRLHSK
ncbi:MAG: hypothetical protein HFF18_09045 [Oscillospiraceae bacterium]|nr:hypothetical protein [Oscillospiraceae bacterium]